MRRLSILHVITRMVVGGAQENTLATVAGLQARGHQVVLATGPSEGPEGSLMPRARESGVKTVIVPDLVRRPGPLCDLRALLDLRSIIRDGRFDVVHTHTSKAGALGRIAARMTRAPVVVHTPHGHVFDGYFGPLSTRVFTEIERVLARWTDAMVAISGTCREDHLRLDIGRGESFVVIPSGIPTASPAERANARRILEAGDEVVVGCVGRLAPIKGQDLLLEAFARVVPRHPDARLVLVGDGPSRATLESRAERLGLNGSVAFLGLRADAPELLPGFDLYVQPSLNEGMGRALAQAMAVGLPPIVSDAPGPRELIGDSGAGVIFPVGDVGALTDALDALLHHPSARHALGEAARRRSSEFWTEKEMVDALERLYFEFAAIDPEDERSDALWPAIS